ncbi:S-layer homology domain-containing protein [Acetivibrio clariflavus]|uniref:Putative S-layer protein n=1 Tax=Acetivibrio clariflavus (strain DSM 19732 / NBRC 101661 / EBR45) TaxID=720554 RepID=G8M1W1_ACECE|nr:S-layer homology domain-containing protein [Acetivibrio clariflavus]AEV67044.1 putative S-layer protein [Acetivibrio clariflavus DSM 19732]
MKILKHTITILVIAALLLGNIPIFQNDIWAAPMPVDIYVESYTDGKLTLRWDVSGATSFSISYHDPDGTLQNISDSGNTYTISNLQDNYIYDFKVDVYSGVNLIGSGLLYYLPRVTFYATQGEQTREAIEGGGYEIGNRPILKLKWVMPKIWVDTSGGKVVSANEALDYINNSYSSIYGTDLKLSKLNFKINISSNASTLNSGAAQSAVNVIDGGSSGYKAYVSGNPSLEAKVEGPETDNYMSLDLVGKKDADSPLPTANGDNELPHGDILPGTVYYMNIKLSFQDDQGNDKFVTTVGAPDDLNGSTLMGEFPYTYTPIRFQLSKDMFNNIYVKIYRINQGSLDLPRLYYQVQSIDQIKPGDWVIKKTIDDSFFASGSDSALTLISGVGVNNKYYYKIVVKTDSTKDRLESLPLEYTLSEDTSKPPIPTGITIIDRVPVKREINEGDKTVIQHSSNITISWEKPANWNEIKAKALSNPNDDIVYHILLNVTENEDLSQPYPELKADGKAYGNFPLKYRKVLSFSSQAVKENGNRLEYTIDGFKLFKAYYFNGLDSNGNPVIVEEDIIREEEDKEYPDFLLPNTVYYMQMYTTTYNNRNSNKAEDMSNKSLIVSFTTRAANEIDVPVPRNLQLNVNDAYVIDEKENIISNYVEIQFDKVDINWNNYLLNTTVSKAVYYDIYMSTRTDLNSFTLIGTTENLNGDIKFFGADDAASKYIRLKVQEFSKGTKAYTVFGPSLKSNTTYYFVVKARLKAEGMERDKESNYSSLLAVTTIKGAIGEPDETSKRPVAPVDFRIAEDEEGNQILSSTKVTFSWTRSETDVVYNIICSAGKIDPYEGNYSGNNDAIYQSFLENFGEIILDPSVETENFEYDPISKECRYTIDKWLSPNRLYYFSIRAINKSDNTIYSVWVSIPVTTLLIEQPQYLEAVTDVQLGFFFEDVDLKTKAEEYSVYIKSETDLRFSLLSKSKYTIVKLGTLSYVRLINLKPNTYYDIRVYKDGDSKLVYTKDELYTRDSSHQLEIKWRGISQYSYEVAIKAISDDDYVLLNESNLEEYIDAQGKIMPYYAQKSGNTIGTEYEYYARIKSIPVRLENGTYENQPLKSNTKYFVKVRAKKIDPVDSTIISYSKFIGPISVRTDFNQDDYDDEDNNTKIEISFMDKIKELEKALFWRIDLKEPDENKLLLKGDRVINAIENNDSYNFILDISYYAKSADIDRLYIPIEVIKTLDLTNKSLLIRTDDAEYSIRPDTFNLETRTEIEELEKHKNVKGIYLTLNIKRNEKSKVSIPNGMTLVSYINKLDIEALGTSLTYTQLKNQINDLVYNKDSGLVQQKLKELLDSKVKGDSKAIEKLINDSVSQIEMEVSQFIYYKLEGGNRTSSIAVESLDIKSFDNPMLVNLIYNEQAGLKLPYVLYKGSSKWQSLSRSTVVSVNKIAFNVIMTGEYAIFAQKGFASDLSDNYEFTSDIKMLLSKFDLSGVFGDLSLFFPEDSIKVKEIILLYEIVTGLNHDNNGLTINQKAQKYGLESLVGYGGVVRDISRQETAKVIMKIYSAKTGVNSVNLIPNSSKIPKDMSKVDDMYYKDVLICLDLGILQVSGEGRFNPDGTITRGELASCLVKLFKLTGDI